VLKKQEHYVIADAEHQTFIGELVPKDGTGESIADELTEMVQSKGIDLDEVKILGGDSTGAITGKYIGAVSKFEQKQNRAVNRCICCLHINELPLCHLGQHYLGSTTSPSCFESPIGKQLENLKNPIIAKFPPIPNPDFPCIKKSVVLEPRPEDPLQRFLGRH
jgi:hypothetical protein